jgi:hypothetical protein
MLLSVQLLELCSHLLELSADLTFALANLGKALELRVQRAAFPLQSATVLLERLF